MDIAKLQLRLGELVHLLPLQQDWFTRLLFQLSFNKIDIIQTLGASASGKTTLTLALAELLSEQSNVALLTAVPEQQAITAIQQQWFGHQAAGADLTNQIAQYSDTQPLCLIIDDGQNFSSTFIQQLTSLSIPCFIFATKPVVAEALTLTINQAGIEDAEQLLATNNLTPEQLSKYLHQAQGDLNLLINGLVAPSVSKQKISQVTLTKPHNRVLLSIGLAALLGTGLVLNYPMFKADAVKTTAQPKLAKQLVANIQQPNTSTDLEPMGLEQSQTHHPIASNIIEPKLVMNDNQLVATNTKVATTINDSEIQTDPDVNAQATKDMVSEPVDLESTVEPRANKALKPVAAQSTELTAKTKVAQTATATVACYSEQLMTANSTEVALQLAVLSKVAAFNHLQTQYPTLNMLCYQRSWQGKSQLVVVLGPFGDNQTAVATQKGLPKKLAASGSFLKSIKAIQAEIAAFNVSQQLSTVD